MRQRRPTPGGRTRVLQILSVLTGSVPFAFGLIRAVQTGSDLRYLLIALASLVGAVMIIAAGRARASDPPGTPVLVAAAFVAATTFAVLAALLIGTRMGLGLVIVAASFGFCSATGGLLHLVAHPRTR